MTQNRRSNYYVFYGFSYIWLIDFFEHGLSFLKIMCPLNKDKKKQTYMPAKGLIFKRKKQDIFQIAVLISKNG